MTKQERQVIESVIRRLRGERASDEVREALTGPAQIYLETWVLPSLEIMLQPTQERDMDLAVRLAR